MSSKLCKPSIIIRISSMPDHLNPVGFSVKISSHEPKWFFYFWKLVKLEPITTFTILSLYLSRVSILGLIMVSLPTTAIIELGLLLR